MDEARTEKINALLNDEQKKQYEELRARGNRGGAPGGGQFQFGGGRPMGSVNVDDVKRELNLTDEQVEKIKPLYDEFNANVQKRASELAEKGFQGLNFAEEMQKYQDSLKALADKVKVHLTDEQKTKLDALVERATGMMRMIPNLMNRGGPPPRPSAEDKAARAVAALKIEKDDEKTAITDLVTKIVKAQYDLEDFTKTSRDRMSEAAKNHDLSDAAVEDRIKESQEDRRKREKDIAALQKQLAEVVTNRQELELMAQGILK
jgi:type I restriction-modification system DNA methylase subunit